MIFEKFLSLLPPELDGALVMSEENRRYFTSFPSSDGALLIRETALCFSPTRAMSRRHRRR